MDSHEFTKKVQQRVKDFCKGLDDNLPAYSYIPLTTDEMRVKVMQSRLFNEVRAAEVFGSWLKTTPELGGQGDSGGGHLRGIRPRGVPFGGPEEQGSGSLRLQAGPRPDGDVQRVRGADDHL